MSRLPQKSGAPDPQPTMQFEPTEQGVTKAALMIDGEEVSRAYIIPFTIRIGSATVRMDGIGGVMTPEEHRNRGYSRQVLQAAVKHMKAGDAALSTLYGIADYYPKFGYATLGPYHVIWLTALDRIPDIQPGYGVRPLVAADLPAVRRLYERATSDLVGPVVRRDDSRSTRYLADAVQQADECRVVVREPDQIVAYLWRATQTWWSSERGRLSPDALAIPEIVAADSAAAQAALGAARRWATELGKKEISISAPPDDPVATATTFLNARVEAHHERDADLMGRCLGLSKLFAALTPELSRRVSAVRTNFTGRLAFITDEGSATLAITPDAVSLVPTDQGSPVQDDLSIRLPQYNLARLAFGSFPPHEILSRLPNPPSDQAADLLSILFPRRHPYIHPPDWF